MVDPAQVTGLAGVPLIVALVALVRQAFPRMPARYCPALCLAIGIALNLLVAYGIQGPAWAAVVVGLIAGEVASRSYQGGKARERLHG